MTESGHVEQHTEYLSTGQAAQLLGASTASIRRMCRKGKFPGALRHDGRWLIPAQLVEQYPRARQDYDPLEPAVDDDHGEEPEPRNRLTFKALLGWAGALATIVTLIFAGISAGADSGVLHGSLIQWGLIREFPPASDTQTMILVATFDFGENLVEAKPHEFIQEAIQNEIDRIGDPQLVVARTSAKLSADDWELARKLGRKYNASMVIWGEDGALRVTIRFLDLRPSQLVVDPSMGDSGQYTIRDPERTQKIDWFIYSKTAKEDWPAQATILALLAVGRSQYLRGNFEGAADAAAEAIAKPQIKELEGGFAAAYYLLGVTHAARGQFREAVDFLTSASDTALGPFDQARILAERGIIHLSRGMPQDAIWDLDLAIQLADQTTHSVMPYTYRGIVKATVGEWNGAMVDFDKAFTYSETPTDEGIVFLHRAKAYMDAGFTEESIEDYDEAARKLPVGPDRAAAFLHRALAKEKIGDVRGALRDYDKAIGEFPGLAVVYNNRGMLWATLGDVDRAFDDLDAAVKLNPYYVEAYFNLSTLYFASGDIPKAIEALDQVILLLPDGEPRALFLSQQADLYVYTYENRDMAVRKLDLALTIALDPVLRSELLIQRAVTRANLEQVRSCITHTGDTTCLYDTPIEDIQAVKLALSDLDEAARLSPTSDRIYFLSGYLRYLLFALDAGEAEEALRDLKRHLELNPVSLGRYETESLIESLEEVLAGP